MNGHNGSKLDTCGCCEAGPPSSSLANLPGLPELKFRVGTHPSFLQRMKARIHNWTILDGELIGRRPLADLATRGGDDASIALIDAWATVADVLSFYQERIANEGFLRTATERRSILELARAIGYELNPGVAAATYVAFTVDDSPGHPRKSTVPAGTQIQSVPAAQGDLPQTFETTQTLVARLAWNALTPKLEQPQNLTRTLTHVYLRGTATNLQIGDLVLLEISGKPYPKRIVSIESDTNEQRTRVDFSQQLSTPSTATALFPKATLDLTHEKLKLTADNVDRYIFKKSWGEEDLQAFLALHDWDEDVMLAHIADLRAALFEDENHCFFALRQRLAFFGHNAPYFASLPDADSSTAVSKTLPPGLRPIEEVGDTSSIIPEPVCTSTKQWPQNWDCLKLSIWKDSLTNQYYDQPVSEYHDVFLERAVPGLVPGSWAVFESPTQSLGDARSPGTEYRSYLINAVSEMSRVGYGMSATVTGLELTDADGNSLPNADEDEAKPERFQFRTSRAHVNSESLKLAAIPITADLRAGDTELWLDAMVIGLQRKQRVFLSGEQLDTDGRRRSELLAISEIEHANGYTKLTFGDGLTYGYKRSTVKINANVVSANHGETVQDEVLGSGDGAAKHQRFELKKSPLTYVSAASASGNQSTLSVRADGVQWTQVASLYGIDRQGKRFVARLDNEAKTTVIFGDGKSGARLPTGQENITATYRTGIGNEGEVGADSLTLLKTRPFGIRSVTNPLKASGGVDPETVDRARDNAPLTVLTLDRIVSLQDHEDFARAFAGIGKAQARSVWDGASERVHITVADANGEAVVSPLYDNLVRAIEDARDPLREVKLESFKPLVFFVSAELLIEEAYLWQDVKANVERALLDAFCFECRNFAQPVTAAEVVQVIHHVDGVQAVDLNELYKTTPDGSGSSGDLLNAVLDAQAARYDKDRGKILPAQLLRIHELGIRLTEMKS